MTIEFTNPTPREDRLLPCPFCGSDKCVIMAERSYEHSGMHPTTKVRYFGECTNCRARGSSAGVSTDQDMNPVGAVAAAVRMWNNRRSAL